MHEVLEYGGSIDQSMWHYAVLIVASRCHEGGLLLVPLTYPDVRAAEVQLGEYVSSA